MARTREVFPSDMVAHLWANGSQETARDRSGNFYFHGPALHSYGSHYVIGFRYVRPDGSVFFLMNDDPHSKTTARHGSIARAAIPRSTPEYYVDGLRGDSFFGVEWRARLLGAMLAQAGACYKLAADTVRRSHVRNMHVRKATDRLDGVRALADAILADKGAGRADRAAARRATKILQAIPAWPEGASNAEEREAATEAVGVLIRNQMRTEMVSTAFRANDAYVDACDSARGIFMRADDARRAVRYVARVRELCKVYRFRCPALPDAAGILAKIEPEEQEAKLVEIAHDARANVERAESVAREGFSGRYGLTGVLLNMERAREDAERAGRPDVVPQVWLDRVRHLQRRAERALLVSCARQELDRVAESFARGDGFAGRGFVRDAVAAYTAGCDRLEKIAPTLPATHPQYARVHGLREELDRVASYLANAEELQRQADARMVEEWRQGTLRSLPWSFRSRSPLLRVSEDGRRVETSWGAEVPADVAPRLWAIVQAARAGHAAEATESGRGVRVGHFALQEVRSDGSLLIGCHDIPYTEIERCARALGIVDGAEVTV